MQTDLCGRQHMHVLVPALHGLGDQHAQQSARACFDCRPWAARFSMSASASVLDCTDLQPTHGGKFRVGGGGTM
jgi:hypothetical protein